MVDGEDIYGDGVNVAARLQSLADPGGVAISGIVCEHIGSKFAAEFEDFGEHTVKNIERPIRVHMARLGHSMARHAPDMACCGGNLHKWRRRVDRSPAVHQHERRCGAGILQRRHH
ncbi:hypothetical protein PYH37_002281 [Sinorhizobium numidicum]|uniref:Guanylate cyclase domain-containing protein n=1 Tax=Sinorhizobium numidicum TaxID=680248 RepID=A0ABY8D2I3_9HYPH|nr:adenylate/guanylate cyclase domain-containing protein [Sinorhizobium numidicum]WEX79074.1 hypothetical protein PYH37_002281 [Sinorhizobium numidicum]WEX85099.1 hypothetical protein PYH38_002994 [Sinorhizobium numidicum]